MKKRNRHKVSRCTDVAAIQYENYPNIVCTGVHDYHSVPSYFTQSIEMGGCVGVEIEMDFSGGPRDVDARAIFCNSIASNVIWCSTDASIRGPGPLEICTVPLLEGDAIAPAFWKPLCDRLVGAGARSYKNSSTGLHVHISRNKFYSNLRNQASDRYEIMCARTIYGLYVQDARWKAKLFGRGSTDYAKNNLDGKIMKFVQTTLPEILHSKVCVEKLVEEARANAHDRYSEFNITNASTVEFRCGKGTLSPERIAAVAEFCVLFAKYCKMFGKRISVTSQKHFEAFILRHARTGSPLYTYIGGEEQ